MTTSNRRRRYSALHPEVAARQVNGRDWAAMPLGGHMQTIQAVLEFLTLSRLGLFVNLAGTIMIAFSVGKNLADAHQFDNKGGKVPLASFLHPELFTYGLVVIILGFVLQLMPEQGFVQDRSKMLAKSPLDPYHRRNGRI